MRTAPQVVHLRIVSFLLLVCLIQWPVASQTTGRIGGTVRDQTAAVIVGAEVLVVSKSSGETRRVITDESGSYSIPLLSPGMYRVTITANGFQEVIFADVNVTITETTYLNSDRYSRPL